MDGTTYTTTLGTAALSATGHTVAEAVSENVADATCTEDGSYESVVYCSVCGEEISRETVTVETTGHTEGDAVTENEVAATCTENGSYDIVVYCTVCGEDISRQAVGVEAADHSYDDGTVTTEPTETEDGLMTYTCTACGDTYTEAIPATSTGDGEDTESECEHDYHVAACILKNQSYSSAYFVLSCSICGDTVQLDADILEEIALDPTCMGGGICQIYRHCRVQWPDLY